MCLLVGVLVSWYAGVFVSRCACEVICLCACKLVCWCVCELVCWCAGKVYADVLRSAAGFSANYLCRQTLTVD